MPGGRRKKRCSEGASCPYKHEYQHQLEFCHDDDNGSFNNNNASSSFQAFSGSGHSLASSNTMALKGRKATTNAGRGRAAEAAMRRAGAGASVLSSSSSTTNTTRRPSSQQRQNTKPRKPFSKQRQEVIVLDSSDDDVVQTTTTKRKRKNAKDVAPVKRLRVKSKNTTQTVSAASSADDAVDLCDCDSDDDWDIVVAGSTRPAPALPLPNHLAGMMESQQLAAAIALSTQTTNAATIPSSSADTSTRAAATLPPRRATGAFRPPNHANNDDESKQLGLAIANSNREITQAQDKDYYESLQADRAKAAKTKREEQEEREKEEMNKILQASRIQAQEEEEQRKVLARKEANELLQDEPSDSEESACIGFRLPNAATTNRVTRRFRPDAPVAQLFIYLRTLKQMSTVDNWTLHQSFDKGEILEDYDETIKDAGLVPRTVIIVKDENA